MPDNWIPAEASRGNWGGMTQPPVWGPSPQDYKDAEIAALRVKVAIYEAAIERVKALAAKWETAATLIQARMTTGPYSAMWDQQMRDSRTHAAAIRDALTGPGEGK